MKKRHLEKKPLASKNTIEVSTAVRLQDFFRPGTTGTTFQEQLEAFLPREKVDDIRKRYVYREDDPTKVAKDLQTVAWKWKEVWDRCVWFIEQRCRRGTSYNCDRKAFDDIEDLSCEAESQMDAAAVFMRELEKDADALGRRFAAPSAAETDNTDKGAAKTVGRRNTVWYLQTRKEVATLWSNFRDGGGTRERECFESAKKGNRLPGQIKSFEDFKKCKEAAEKARLIPRWNRKRAKNKGKTSQ